MVPRRLSHAQENPVTAIDIALEPDATMVRQAEADNARLLKAYPEGFALDATHHAHITMLQQFVRTADLKKVSSAANAVLAKEGVASRRLKAINYHYIPSPPLGIAGIVVESTEDLIGETVVRNRQEPRTRGRFVQKGEGYTTFAAANPRNHCNFRPTKGSNLTYVSNPAIPGKTPSRSTLSFQPVRNAKASLT